MAQTIYSLKLYNNDNNFIYKNVKFYYYNYNSKLIPWYDIFFYYFIMIENKIYINDYEFTHVYDYFLENKNQEHLIKSKIFNYNSYKNIIKNKCVLIKNLYTNAGHSFCNLLNQIFTTHKEIKNINEYCILITIELKKYNVFLYSLISLFFKEEKITIISTNELIIIDELYMIPDFSCKTKESVEFLHKTLITSKEKKNYSKIIAIKTNNTQNCTNGTFEDEYVKYFESYGFIFIKCEDYDIIELYNILNSAEYIIMSWGCNSYLNSILINNDISNVFVIANIKYQHEYIQFLNDEINTDWFPYKCKNKFFLGDLTEKFTQQIKMSLDDKMNIFLNK